MQVATLPAMKAKSSLTTNTAILSSLVALLVCTMFISLRVGALGISVGQIVNILLHNLGLDVAEVSSRDSAVLLSIRLPRLVLGVAVGGALGISGAALQGLFRNPLVEPGIIGISNGAALMAVVVLVFGPSLALFLTPDLTTWLLPVAAFSGSLAATYIAYQFSKGAYQTDVTILILAGVAITALCAALMGIVIFHSNETALRSFTFWSMGDLSGASWDKIGFAIWLIVLPAVALIGQSQALNAMALGESEARHLGVEVEKIKHRIILLSALAVGASVAMAGAIGFIGLVVPHILRMAFGPDHKLILPASAIGGAILLTVADMIARTIVAPTELPIGIITALMGTPFFIWMLASARKKRIQI
tara:strand:+ start:569 stop:1654 length:1086 start_codon:yes stop_codon:yes gene_type:complete